MTTITEVLENAGGAALIAGTVVLRPLLASRYRRWNTTGDEAVRALPGDERVPASLVTQTLAVTIKAPPAAVWPWLAQIGQERGGLYSYELLENIARCQMHNADRIVPEWELHVGDLVRLGPPGFPVHKVVGLERGHWLLLAGADIQTGAVPELPKPGQGEYTNYAWVFFLRRAARWHDPPDHAQPAGLCTAQLCVQADLGVDHRPDRLCDDPQDAAGDQAARRAAVLASARAHRQVLRSRL